MILALNDKLKINLDNEGQTEARALTLAPNEYFHLDHGYAVSIHRAQGCTVNRSFVLSSVTMDDNLAYVVMTRHRDEVGLYGTKDKLLPLYQGDLARPQKSPRLSSTTPQRAR